MSAKTVTIVAAAILVGGTLLASAGNATSAPQGTVTDTNHNIYAGHGNGAATNAELISTQGTSPARDRRMATPMRLAITRS